MRRIACLAGGVGAARFLTGLREIIPEKDLAVIVNTGDDDEFYGLYVSPDLDIISYTLAGIVDEEKGWGIRDDTFSSLNQLAKYDTPTWFRIGDRDFAAHIFRTQLLKQGHSLTATTEQITTRLGLKCKILPMTNSAVRTLVHSAEGQLSFQEYFVRDAFRPAIQAIDFQGINEAEPTPEVKDAIQNSDGIIICPSNPIVSIAPILSLKGLRETLKRKRRNTVAISPIVGGKTLKGPADRMMKSLGHEASAYGVARLYSDIAETLIIDHQDRHLRQKIEELGMKAVITDTVMQTREKKAQLAELTVRSLGILA